MTLLSFEDVKVVIIEQDPYHGRDRHTACVFQSCRG
jgi:uracil DNA glycosylase